MHGALKKDKQKNEEEDTRSSFMQFAKAITKAVKSSLKKSSKKQKQNHSDSSDISDSE